MTGFIDRLVSQLNDLYTLNVEKKFNLTIISEVKITLEENINILQSITWPRGNALKIALQGFDIINF